MKQIRSKLSDKREKKLSYDYKYIEKLTEDFLIKYQIDAEMEIFIQDLINKYIDLDLAYTNVTSNKNYEPQIGPEFFRKIVNYLETLLKKDINLEIENLRKQGLDEDVVQKHKEILENTMELIELTMFEHGIGRTTLTAYHYFLKILHKNTEAFMTKNNYKKIKGIKNPNELLAKEIYSIIGKDNEMTRFVLTLKNLIEQWLIKYTNKTKIGDFYYDILMITPEFIVEKILKYLVMVAIRNKNPMTLRAIFSSYITLIHKNLFSYYATNLSKVKVGYFKQLENLFTENFDLIHERDNNTYNPKKNLMTLINKVYLMKNKRYLINDLEFFSNDYYQFYFEPNYSNLLSTYNYSIKMNILDHHYMYNSIIKYTKVNEDDKIKSAKILKQELFKKNNKKKNMIYIKEKLIKKLFSIFYNIFGDKETVLVIIESMATDIMKKLNLERYLDKETLTPIKINFNDYLNNIDEFIENLEKIILHENRLLREDDHKYKLEKILNISNDIIKV